MNLKKEIPDELTQVDFVEVWTDVAAKVQLKLWWTDQFRQSTIKEQEETRRSSVLQFVKLLSRFVKKKINIVDRRQLEGG